MRSSVFPDTRGAGNGCKTTLHSGADGSQCRLLVQPHRDRIDIRSENKPDAFS